MKKNKKILALGALGLLPISILPLTVISCSNQEEGEKNKIFEISSDGEIRGFNDKNFKHFGLLTIKEKYEDVTIKSISPNAFNDQKNITSISLPKTLVELGPYSFYNIESPVHFPYNHDSLIPLDWDLSHLAHLEVIGEYAFGFSEYFLGRPLFSLNLSGANKLREIQKGAFYQRGIPSLNLPNSITTIGDSAFYGNPITSLTLPNSITTIGASAFRYNQLSSLTLPNSLTTIGEFAFELSDLTSITIPDSVTTIGDGAFTNNAFTPTSEIILPTQFDNDTERERIGLPPKTSTPASLETDFIPLTVESRVKGK